MSPQIGHGSRQRLGRKLNEQSEQIKHLTSEVHKLTSMVMGIAESIAELEAKPEFPEE